MNAEVDKLLLQKAGALLSRRSYSRGELRNKLAKFDEGVAVERVLDRLEQLNLLNDEEYAYNFAFCRMRQNGWAPAKVQNALLHRNVEQRIIHNALDRVQSEPGYESGLVRFVQDHCRKKGLPASPKEIRKLISYLHHRGYGEERILETLRQILPRKAWQQFETGE